MDEVIFLVLRRECEHLFVRLLCAVARSSLSLALWGSAGNEKRGSVFFPLTSDRFGSIIKSVRNAGKRSLSLFRDGM